MNDKKTNRHSLPYNRYFKAPVLAGTLLMLLGAASCSSPDTSGADATEVLKWPGGRSAAISITYDDGNINQFQKAMPIMDSLGIPGTFFIITGNIPGSENQGKFIGRDVQEIIAETAAVPTNDSNFFERASAIGFSGYKGAVEYHTRAGGRYEAGKIAEAHQIIDEGYAKIRNGELAKGEQPKAEVAEAAGTTWDDIRAYAAAGHEFASHTVTHPYLSVLDETNLLYELESSKADIEAQLGAPHTFSAEGPYGTEDPRVVEHINKIYDLTRNKMTDEYLIDLNRSDRSSIASHAANEYVRWQRGVMSNTPLADTKAWVDTAIAAGNTWLVLVYHGVDGIGWEAVKSEEMKSYFGYMKEKENDVWVATFGNVGKYIRERMNAQVTTTITGNTASVSLSHQLDTAAYNLPLTLKTYLPSDWTSVQVQQGDSTQTVATQQDEKGTYVQYDAYPNTTAVQLTNQQ